MKVFLILLLILNFNNANAAHAEANATLKWYTFKYVNKDNNSTATISPSNDAPLDYVSAKTTSPDEFKSDSERVDVGNSTTLASAEDKSFILQSISKDANESAPSTAESKASRSIVFTGSGNGTFIFTIDYSVINILFPGNSDPNYATSDLSLSYYNYSSASVINEAKVTISGHKSAPVDGTLTLEVPFENNQRLNISAEILTKAAVTSVVPIPAAFWFMGSGVLGLIGLRRKVA